MTPDKYTNQELFVEVGDGNQLYVQDWGRPDATVPIVFLHGGPGGGCDNRHKARFDPLKQRVIFFDQRGSGKSLPTGSLEHNTTPKLIEDIQIITAKLDLPKFIMTGGSWGSCLALAYAIKHPSKVAGLVLHGILTGSKAEIDWLDQGRFKEFFPDAWESYLQATPKDHRHDPTSYHFKRALGSDLEEAKQSAYVYQGLEMAVLKLNDKFSLPDYETYDPAAIRTEIHYMANGCFMPDNHILDNAAKIKAPVWLIQGRYDMVCPPITAYRLDQALPNSRLIFTINGHAAEHESSNIMHLAQLHLAGEL